MCRERGGKVLQLLRALRNILIGVFGSQNRDTKPELGQNWYVPFYLLLGEQNLLVPREFKGCSV